MSTRHPAFWRSLVGAMLLSFVPTAAGAVEHEVRILLDLDDDAGTGCLVNTVEGPFDGVEQVLITTVETSTSPNAGTVTDAAISDCIDSGTDTFGVPASFDGGWPVGVGNGEGGRDVVETYFPLVASVVDEPRVIRLGVVVTDEQGGEQALLTVDGGPGGEPIVLDLRSVLEIPTLGEGGLLLLVLLLAGASVALLGRRGTVAFAVVLVVLSSGVAWAAGVLDGLTDDWSPGDLLGSNGLVLFGKGAAGELCFRVDVDLLFDQPPTAEPDAFATDEDSVLSGENVLADNGSGPDTDPEGGTLTVTAFDATSAEGAAITVAANGDMTYDPTGAPDLQALPAGGSVDDTFTYTVEDPAGGTDTATVTVTVGGVNDAPTAAADGYSTDEEVQLNVAAPGVLDNDDDVDTGDTLTAVLDSGVSNGTLTLNADGSFTYDPAADFSGTDTFTYHAFDGTASSATVTVTIDVANVNDPPDAVDDGFTVDEDTTDNSLDVLANDSDAPDSGETLTITAVGVPDQGGTATHDGSTVTYTPAADFAGIETFTYTISDGNGGSDTATVSVTVQDANDDPPLCGADAATTDEDTSTLVEVLSNDTDPDPGQTATLVVSNVDVSGTTGTVVNNGTDVTYDPNGAFESLGAGDSATDTFSYTAQDTDGLTCTATVTVTVTGVNDAPAALGETFDVAAGNFDPAIGNTTLRFAAGSSSLTHPHVFQDGTVLDNDSDPEGDPVTIVAVDGDAGAVGSAKTLPSGAVVTLQADGELTYEPPLGFEGTGGSADSFTYTLSDGSDSAVATITVEIAEMVWYLDGDASGGGNDGRSASPFESVAAFNAVQGGGLDSQPEAGDAIFLHDASAAYSGGIGLLDQQKLFGEGFGLLVGGNTLVPAGTRPALENGAGDAVTVAADLAGGDRTGIEVRGLALSSTPGSAIAVSSADAQAVEVTITDNLIDEAGGAGIDLAPGSSGDFTVAVADNAWSTSSPSGAGFALATAAANSGDVVLALDGNSDVTGGGGGVVVDGSAGSGAVYVTSLAGNTVSGATGAKGMLFDTVVFDADPSDADFNGDTVAAGSTVVGTTGDRVGGFGLALQAVTGDLSFGDLDVANDGGTGLQVVSPALFAPGAGTGFRLTTGADSTIDTANAPAVDVDPATLAASFASVTSSNSSGVGISLTDTEGTFSATGGSLATAGGGSGPTFEVNGGSVAASYGGSVLSTAGHSVRVQDMTGGTVTLSGPVDDDGAGVSITGNTAATSVAFDGGLDLVTNTDTAFTATGGGSVTVASAPSNTIETTTGTGVLVNGVDAVGGFDFDSVSVSNGGGAGISLQSSAGTKTFGLVSVTNTGGPGLFASSAGTVNVTDASSTIVTTGHPAVDADTTTFGASFASLSSSTSGTTGIDLQGVGGSFTAGSVTIDDTTGAGVQLSGNGAAVALNGGTIGETTNTATTTGGNAVDVDGGTGAVTIGADITNTVARSVEVTTRPGSTVTVSGTILDTGTGINVTGNSGGSTLFSNPSKVLSTGASPAVTLTSNGLHAVDFTNGGLEITTTTGTGFQATGGGTVTVTGSGNTIGAATPSRRTAVEIDGATIGANGVTFESLSVDAGPTGSDTTAIVLADTGAGAFTVTGDGTTTFGGNGSGGILQNLTDVDAVTLSNIGGPVTLQNMTLRDIGDSGDGGDVIGTRSLRDAIHGESVTGGLTLQSVTVRRTSDHAILGALHSDGFSFTTWDGLELRDSLFENANRFHVAGRGDDVDEGIVRVRGLTGTVVVDNCTFRNGARGLDLTTPPGAGTLDATVQASTFENLYKEFDTGGTRNVGGRGVAFEARGDHDMVVRIGDPAQASSALGNTFTNNFTASVVIFGQEGGGDPHTGDVDAVISQNTFVVTDHSTPQTAKPDFSSFDFPQGGVSLNPAGSGTFEAIVSNNLFDEVMHAAGGFGQLTIGHNTGDGASEFIVRGNEFRKAWDMMLRLRAEGNGSMAVLVEDNAWTKGLVGGAGTDFEGGNCGTGDPIGFCPTPFQGVRVNVRNDGAMDLTMRNEDLPQHDDVNDGAFTFIAEVQAQPGNVLNLYLDDNQASDGYRLIRSDGTFNLFRENAADTTAADIVDGNGNTGGNGTVSGDPDTDGGGTDPPVVSADAGITPTDTAPTLPSIVIP